MHSNGTGTFQMLIIVSFVPGLTTRFNFIGRFGRRIFLSEPIRLLKSKHPLPFPSALKQTPHLLIATLRESRCVLVLLLQGLSKLSFWSQSIASVNKFLVKTSVQYKRHKIFGQYTVQMTKYIMYNSFCEALDNCFKYISDIFLKEVQQPTLIASRIGCL